jgi:hypothetical protein
VRCVFGADSASYQRAGRIFSKGLLFQFFSVRACVSAQDLRIFDVGRNWEDEL